MLTRDEMASAFAIWGAAWNEHDLDGVMDLFDDEIYFENWTGASVRGKENLRKAWAPWFANHGDFKFTTEETFIDEVETEDALPLAARLALVREGPRRQTRSQGAASISCTSGTARSFRS